MRRPPLSFILALALMLPAFAWMHYGMQRGDFMAGAVPGDALPLLGLYSFLFVLYAWAVMRGNDLPSAQLGIGAGLIIRLMLVFALPNLSDDFYRFLWDGRMGLAGWNPYNHTPRELMAQLGPDTAAAWQGLYAHLNSKDYHTVYPPVLQAIFTGATWLGKTEYGTMVVLKLAVVMAEAASLWFLQRIVRRFQLPHRSILVYALNPLVISELSGNLHFEAFMICFMLAALWTLMLSRPLSASIFFALAICSKLLPVLAFPFLIRRLGWGRTLLMGLLTAVFVGGLFSLYFDREGLEHFGASLRLYFNNFEFNGGIYSLGKWALGDQYFWLQRILPWVVMATILVSAWQERDRIWRGFAAALMLALALYQLAAPVVHPWYLTPIVALCVLGPFRFPVVWSALIPFTYLSYFYPGVQEQAWVLWGEYGLLFAFMAYEAIFVRRRRTLEEWMRSIPSLRRWLQATIPARLKIKQHRISRLLQPGTRILDLGTGNGGLCRALRQEGFDVQPCDVKDISFFPEIQPLLYNGQRLPFQDREFDSTLLITVLHHTPDPDAVLDEALRVTSRRLIVMEDIYKNPFQKYLTYFTDSLVNMEFVGHPHTNRSESAWLATFAAKGLKVVEKTEFRTLVFFRQVIYVLEPSLMVED